MTDASAEPFFSVVVLNWNTLELLKRNLAALKAQSYPSLEVIVVDNGSVDGSVDYLNGDEFKSFGYKRVMLSANTGFAAGMNEGLRISSGNWLMPLNVDVFLAPDFFEKASVKIKADPGVTMLGPLIYRYDKESGPTEEVLCTYVVPTPFLSLATDLTEPFAEKFVFAPGGCAPLFMASELKWAAIPAELSASGKTEYYDERYFAYGEDIDLYLRLNAIGGKALYAPSLKCHHVHSGSQSGVRWYEKSADTITRLGANALDTCLKNLRGFGCFKTFILLFLAPLGRSLYLLFRAPSKFIAPLKTYALFGKRLSRTKKMRAYFANLKPQTNQS
ncbi:glycosyltransferase family 2 protein [bacterium]|nr:glycosyltransferase family 2 protein [bacterium]